ncbi:DUF4157 domain-containing protein [Synechococcus sp. PCC 7336]|uniref:eCIS core domain-containing protein n=1 Tax=Synechococcus sp. PCC 7336 TaxID=195250 RepID=UPI00034B471D|nr:DUF4157 domain-containing protein [Synechococcus sp. PCC 7336]
MSHRKSRPHRKTSKLEESREPFFDRTRSGDRNFFSPAAPAPVQTKLEMGKPGDKFEREADTVADSVVNGQADSPVQQKPEESLHRQAEEEEMAQTKLQMQEEEEEAPQAKLQMQEEEEMAQTKLQMQSEEEEMAQTKSESGAPTATPALVDRIRPTKGSGNPLPDRTRAEMGAHFGRDFSDVRIHTDGDAVDMNRQLKSQAFAQGKDLYFNQGKFDPQSKDGKHLLAHELAHVVQQNKAKPKPTQSDTN